MRLRVLPCLVLAVSAGAAAAAATAAEQAPVRVSVNMLGGSPDGASYSPRPSKGGRFIAFTSEATDLVEGDTNNVADMFVLDSKTGVITRVSLSNAGGQADAGCYESNISDNGRWISFESEATNLVEGDTNGVSDIFVHDRKTGTTRRVSVSSEGAQGTDEAYDSQVSGNGRFVAFDSDAPNLVPGDTNATVDSFLHDLKTGRTVRASVGPDGEEAPDGAHSSGVSKTGRYVVFATLSDEFGARDGYTAPMVRDMKTGRVTLGARTSFGAAPDSNVFFYALSANGKAIAFSASDPSMTPAGNPSGRDQLYWMSLRDADPILVSRTADGAPGDDESIIPAISANGRLVAFNSDATNLAEGDGNAAYDVFVADPRKRTLRLASCTSAGVVGNGISFSAALSPDGRTLGFNSRATNLDPADAESVSDIYIVSTK